QMKSVFQALQAEGIAILFIEQNVRLALSMAGRGYILQSGHLAIEGDAPTLINTPEARRIFLCGEWTSANHAHEDRGTGCLGIILGIKGVLNGVGLLPRKMVEDRAGDFAVGRLEF